MSCKKSGDKNYEKYCKKELDEDRACDHFVISVTTKDGHPWCHRIIGTNDALAVNGIKGKTIHVWRGKSYKFTFKQNLGNGYDAAYSEYAGCPPPDTCDACQIPQQEPYGIYFTEDPMGGRKGDASDCSEFVPVALEGTPSPVNCNCTIKFTIGKKFPGIFYYQTANYRCMGGVIVVHDSSK